MSSRRVRLATMGASTLLTVSALAWWWPDRSTPDSVRMVDIGAELAPELRTRSRGGRGAREVNASESGLVREPMPPEMAKKLFATLRYGEGGRHVYDPATYYWPRSNLDLHRAFDEHPTRRSWRNVTNELGFKHAAPVMTEKPALRVLVTGDSHTGGVLPMQENFSSLLSNGLSLKGQVEVLNGGNGGFSFYNYLGVLEKFTYLDPDVFVCAVYGGNDFLEAIPVYRYFQYQELPRLVPPAFTKHFKSIRKSHGQLTSQSMNQELKLLWSPDMAAEVLECATQISRAIGDHCARNGIALAFVYIPPVHDVQPHLIGDQLDAVCVVLDTEVDALDNTDRLATAWIDATREMGLRVIDMRPIYAVQEEPAYWPLDQHINTLGHQLIFEALAAEVFGEDPVSR